MSLLPPLTKRYSRQQPHTLEQRAQASTHAGGYNPVSLRNVDQRGIFESETQYRKLFLREYARMAAEQKVPLDAVWLYKQVTLRHPAGIYSNMPLLQYGDLEAIPSGKDALTAESVTRYEMLFDALHTQRGGNDYSAANYIVDKRAWELLADYGVDQADQKKWGALFLWMADLAGHEYLHQVLLPGRMQNEKMLVHTSGSIQANILPVEYLALSLHANICQRLRKQSPERESYMLGKAADYFDHLAMMQQKAYASPACKTEEDRAKIDEAITYLADIYAHRLFRAFRPSEKRLTQPIRAGSDGGSLEDHVNHLTLFRPQPGGGLKTLAKHTEKQYGQLYERIHLETSIPMQLKKSEESVMVPLAKAAVDFSFPHFAAFCRHYPELPQTQQAWADWLKTEAEAKQANKHTGRE